MRLHSKFLMIYVGALAVVSCAIPPTRPPKPETTIDKPDKPDAPAESVPTPPLMPEIRPTLPTPQPEPSPPIPAKPPTPPSAPTTPPIPVAWLPASLTVLRETQAVPGGIAWIALHSQSRTPPKIIYQQQRVLVLRDEYQWVALVGLPLDAKLGRHTVSDQQTGKYYHFSVKDKKYKTQRLKVKKRTVDLPRIQRERALIKAALATPWRATAASPLPLMQPVKGRFSSSFGLRRYFNGKPGNPHTGLDIAVQQGTPVAASAAGIVVNTGHYFFTGNTVLIDHGQGVVTLYAHLHTMVVSPGDFLEKGQTIGTVGKTGRVTGPHLHWSVSLNQTMIDPKLVMQ